MVRVLSVIEDTMVDGPGFRTSIYCAGCSHGCKGCHNPQSWDFSQGRLMTTDELMEVIESDPYTRGVTFSGGDPMYQPEGFAELAEAIRERTPQKDIWCYTGFTFEALLNMAPQRALLQQIDVLVDGPYVAALHDETLLFRGSSNQRLVNVRQSLRQGRVVVLPDNPQVL